MGPGYWALGIVANPAYQTARKTLRGHIAEGKDWITRVHATPEGRALADAWRELAEIQHESEAVLKQLTLAARGAEVLGLDVLWNEQVRGVEGGPQTARLTSAPRPPTS